MTKPQHVLEIHIAASCEQVWEALTDPAMTEAYWFATRRTTTWAVGGRWALEHDGDEVIVGDIVEGEPPHRLVVTFALVADDELAAERPSRCTWTIEPVGAGCRVRLVHDDFHGRTVTWSVAGGMWPRVLSGLKSLLETGRGLGLDVLDVPRTVIDADREEQAAWGRRTNARVWELLGTEERTPAQDRELVAAAHASAWHWSYGGTELNEQRAEWLLARALLAVGDITGALRHAERCWELTETHGFGDFDFAYACEGRFRALRAAGRVDEADEWFARAEAAAASIADPDDRDWFVNDLHS